MFILYTYQKGRWEEFESFKDRRSYADSVKTAVEKKLSGDSETQKKAAAVMADFVYGKKYFSAEYQKLVMRALRHFDEVGLSNDIYEALESLDGEAFALAKDGEDITAFARGEFDFEI